MKIKNDFVTNSSSTCYVYWGIEREIYEVEEHFKLSNNTLGEFLLNKLREIDLDYDIWYESDMVFLGREPNEMEEDETKKEFKLKILSGLKELGFDLKYEDIKYIKEANTN